jgi:hypothetical protein
MKKDTYVYDQMIDDVNELHRPANINKELFGKKEIKCTKKLKD